MRKKKNNKKSAPNPISVNEVNINKDDNTDNKKFSLKKFVINIFKGGILFTGIALIFQILSFFGIKFDFRSKYEIKIQSINIKIKDIHDKLDPNSVLLNNNLSSEASIIKNFYRASRNFSDTFKNIESNYEIIINNKVPKEWDERLSFVTEVAKNTVFLTSIQNEVLKHSVSWYQFVKDNNMPEYLLLNEMRIRALKDNYDDYTKLTILCKDLVLKNGEDLKPEEILKIDAEEFLDKFSDIFKSESFINYIDLSMDVILDFHNSMRAYLSK